MGWPNFVHLLVWVGFVSFSSTYPPKLWVVLGSSKLKTTHLPGTFPAVGPWASVLRLDCYIRSAPEDTHAPRIQHVQASARFCASKLCAYLHTRSDFRSRDF